MGGIIRKGIDGIRVSVLVDLVTLEGTVRAIVEDAGAGGVDEDGVLASCGTLLDAIKDGLDRGQVVGCCGVDGDLWVGVRA